MTAWVARPPQLPPPAAPALAVPTPFGANITQVWYCVMTKPAPIAPISRRKNRKLSYDCAAATPNTGSAPTSNKPV